MIKKNDIVQLLPEFCDEGDEDLCWQAVEDEDGGRVKIMPADLGMDVLPVYVVNTNMLV